MRRSGDSDSGSTKRPYIAFARLSPAATQNGRRGPPRLSTPPSTGPTMKPTPNAAPMSPNDFARPSAGVTSAMYANAAGTLAAVTPEIMRPTNSHPSVGASAIST